MLFNPTIRAALCEKWGYWFTLPTLNIYVKVEKANMEYRVERNADYKHALARQWGGLCLLENFKHCLIACHLKAFVKWSRP